MSDISSDRIREFMSDPKNIELIAGLAASLGGSGLSGLSGLLGGGGNNKNASGGAESGAYAGETAGDYAANPPSSRQNAQSAQNTGGYSGEFTGERSGVHSGGNAGSPMGGNSGNSTNSGNNGNIGSNGDSSLPVMAQPQINSADAAVVPAGSNLPGNSLSANNLAGMLAGGGIGSDKRIALLKAIKPYVNDEKKQRVDGLVKAISVAGILNNYKGGLFG